MTLHSVERSEEGGGGGLLTFSRLTPKARPGKPRWNGADAFIARDSSAVQAPDRRSALRPQWVRRRPLSPDTGHKPPLDSLEQWHKGGGGRAAPKKMQKGTAVGHREVGGGRGDGRTGGGGIPHATVKRCRRTPRPAVLVPPPPGPIGTARRQTAGLGPHPQRAHGEGGQVVRGKPGLGQMGYGHHFWHTSSHRFCDHSLTQRVVSLTCTSNDPPPPPA